MSLEYPFYQNARDELRLPDGRPLEDLTLEAIRSGEIQAAALGAHPDTLRAQARVAEEAGFSQVGENLRRAAELTAVPDGRLLEIYDALRPGRSTPAELEAIAVELERRLEAPLTAAFVREAARAIVAEEKGG